MDKQIIGAESEISCEEVLRASAGLLAVGRGHARVRTKDGWCAPRGRRSQRTAFLNREQACCCACVGNASKIQPVPGAKNLDPSGLESAGHGRKSLPQLQRQILDVLAANI